MDFMKLFYICLLFHAQVSAQAALSWYDWGKKFFLSNEDLAINAYRSDDFHDALVLLHNQLDANPFDASTNYNIGVVLYKKNKYQDAQNYFLRAVQSSNSLKTLQEQAYFNLGNCYYQQKSWYHAIDAYENVLKINPDNQNAVNNLQLARKQLEQEELKNKENKEKENQDHQEKQDSNQQCDHGQNESDQSDSQSGNKNSHDSSDNGQKNNKQSSLQDQSEKDSEQQSGSNQVDEKDQKNNEKGMSDSAGNNEQGKEEISQTLDRDQTGQESNGQAENQKVDAHEKSLQHDEKQAAHQEQSLESMIDNAGKQDGENLLEHHESVQEQSNKRHEMLEHEKDNQAGAFKDDFKAIYEGKASDDQRLNEYHASIMKTLEDLEEKIQKNVIKNKVAMQGSNKHGQKGW